MFFRGSLSTSKIGLSDLITLLELASVHILLYIIDTEEALLYNSIDWFMPRNMKSVQSPLVNTFFSTNIFTGK